VKLKTLACFVLILLVASLVSAQQNPASAMTVRGGAGNNIDWAQFHFDPGLSGYNPYETVIGPANVGTLAVKWSYAPAEHRVEGPPAVVNGKIYFTTSFYLAASGPLRPGDWDAIYALNADTGELIWKYELGGPVFASPAVANGVVYVVGAEGVYALNANTGVLIWQYALDFQGQYCSPTIANNILYLMSGQYVYALNATNGTLAWKHAIVEATHSSPAVADGVLYINSGPGIVYALNATSGVLVWKKQFGITIGPSLTNSSAHPGQAVADGVLYVPLQTKPKTNTYDLYALNASTGTVIWRTELGVVQDSQTPAVANGRVYVLARTTDRDLDKLYALDTTSGQIVWQAEDGGQSSPVIANGVVYTGSLADPGIGVIKAFDALSGTLLWNYQTSMGVEGYDFFPTPVVVNGTVYGSNISAGVGEVSAWTPPNQ
jgi:outer membrane protein assembly factor BamB